MRNDSLYVIHCKNRFSLVSIISSVLLCFVAILVALFGLGVKHDVTEKLFRTGPIVDQPVTDAHQQSREGTQSNTDTPPCHLIASLSLVASVCILVGGEGDHVEHVVFEDGGGG